MTESDIFYGVVANEKRGICVCLYIYVYVCLCISADRER